MREMVVGLRAREMLERKARKVGLDRDAGGGQWDRWCRDGVCKRVCVCVSGWVGGWVIVYVCVMVVVGVVGSVGNARAKFNRFGSMSSDVGSSKD